MRTVIRTKNIKGTDYLYEITYYYDKTTKRTRQHSKYLGKAVDGKPVKVRDTSGTPRAALSYGEFLPVLAASETYRLEENLQKYLTPNQAKTVLLLAYNRTVRPLALSHIESWYHGTIFSRKYPDIPLSSQTLSNLLAAIGRDGIPLKFFQNMITQISPRSTLLYDITSISSYTTAIPIFEYGHNRDGLPLPQINLSLVVDKERGIPVFYDMYPGSIVDVSTLRNTIAKITSMGVPDCTMVLDRGFCSTENLHILDESRFHFIIPASRSFKVVKEALSKLHVTVKKSKNLKKFKGKTIFAEPITLKIGALQFKGYGYYSPSREKAEFEHFFSRLHDTIERLQSLVIRPYVNPSKLFEDYAGTMKPYLSWIVDGSQFVITPREKAIAQYTNKLGVFILIYNGELTWDACLSLYRSRDLVEKLFDVLKNDLDIMPINVKTQESLAGLLFITYLSLLLRMHIVRQIQSVGLQKKHSLEHIFVELEKIRWIELPDDKCILTEVGKKQREILDALNIAPDVNAFV